MADNLPMTTGTGTLSAAGFGAAPSGPMLERVKTVLATDPVRKALPAFLAVAAIGAAALAYGELAPSSQRMLYGQIADGDRAAVVQMLDGAGIDYSIDNATGALSVAEEDYYRARMLVAADGAVGTPESGMDLLDAMPLGASRTMEGERLRAARERELMLTIGEIDGVDSVRVHLAEPERSAFVRDSVPPSASVMLNLARGRQLSGEQVRAISNLVAASVPGLDVAQVRVVDQSGRLLSDPREAEDDRLSMQARTEAKLRGQLDHLLMPMFGNGQFSSEIQVELDMDEVTRASETYGREGSLRNESIQNAASAATAPAAGIPGALSNTPPENPDTEERPPEGMAPAPTAATPSANSAASRNWDLDREVAVANQTPGRLTRLSVAVALSAEAMKNAKASEIDEIKALIGSAMGIDEARGDRLTVMVRPFTTAETAVPAFYETTWFARLARYGAAVLAVLLVLLLAVRPMIKALRRKPAPPTAANYAGDAGNDDAALLPAGEENTGTGERAMHVIGQIEGRERLERKVSLARQMVADQPDNAAAALRQMLREEARPAGSAA